MAPTPASQTQKSEEKIRHVNVVYLYYFIYHSYYILYIYSVKISVLFLFKKFIFTFRFLCFLFFFITPIVWGWEGGNRPSFFRNSGVVVVGLDGRGWVGGVFFQCPGGTPPNHFVLTSLGNSFV
jgi:hypothetical protein